MSKLKIVATIVAKPEFERDILSLLHTVTDATRKEEGNIFYTLHKNIENSLKFTIIEGWKSQDAINYHNRTEHFLLLQKGLEEKADSFTIDILQEIY